MYAWYNFITYIKYVRECTFGITARNQNYIPRDMKYIFKSENACCSSIENLGLAGF